MTTKNQSRFLKALSLPDIYKLPVIIHLAERYSIVKDRFQNSRLRIQTMNRRRSIVSTLKRPGCGGGKRIRTADPLRARQVLSQLSYTPNRPPGLLAGLVGLGRVELPTSRLSGVRSNQLSYRPFRVPALSPVYSSKALSSKSSKDLALSRKP